MKKTFLIIVLIVIVLSLSIYYQTSLSNSEITSSTVTTTGMVVEDQKKVEQEDIPNKLKEPVIEEEVAVEKIEPASEEEFPTTFITDAKCINGKEITFTLNNILNKEILTDKLTFYAAGYTIRNPVCDNNILNPKESTDCKLNLKIKINNIIQFTIAYPAKSQSVKLDCGR